MNTIDRRKIALTNVPSYYVTDETCELMFLRAQKYGFKEVIAGPSTAEIAKKFKENLKLGVTIAYPAGAVYPELKAAEIADFEESFPGLADAYYVTAAVGYFLSGHSDFLKQEMEKCVAAASGKPVYFFLEAAEMPGEKLAEACEIAKAAGVRGLVASNGFIHYDIKRSGAKEIAQMKRHAGDLEVLACGMLNSTQDILDVLAAGADRVILDKPEAVI